MTSQEFPDVARFERDEFIRHRFQYKRGEHVTFLGPTGWGKTRFMNELLDANTTERLPGILLASKPKDEEVADWTARMEYQTVKSWPPSSVAKRLFHGKPRGWTLWPPHSYDPAIDDVKLEETFRVAILDSYKRGNRVLVVDEILDMVDLYLSREMRTILTRGRSQGTGMWAGTQKPTDIPTHFYGQAQHLFLGNDSDARSRKRFGEIGGIDPKLVEALVMSLRKYEWLYIRRDGPKVCIVKPGM